MPQADARSADEGHWCAGGSGPPEGGRAGQASAAQPAALPRSKRAPAGPRKSTTVGDNALTLLGRQRILGHDASLSRIYLQAAS